VVQAALDKFAASPVFSALRKRRTDLFGNEVVFSCSTGYTCISLKEKLMCISLKIDDLYVPILKTVFQYQLQS